MSIVKILRYHISFIIPLVAFLFSLQLFFVVEKLVDDYKSSLINEYAIVVASVTDINIAPLRKKIGIIDRVEAIDAKVVLDKIKDNVSEENLALLRVSLPKFYRIILKQYPNNVELKRIENILKTSQTISDVETFSKSHDKIYDLLLISKGVSRLLAIILAIVSITLIIKQVKVWSYEHLERVEVMALFGATSWMRSRFLFYMAVIDSFVATLIVAGVFIYTKYAEKFRVAFEYLGAKSIDFTYTSFGILFVVALVMSLASVILVLSRQTHRTEG